MKKQPTDEANEKPIFWYASDSGIVPDTDNTGYSVACAFVIIIVSMLLFFGLWAAFPVLTIPTCGLFTAGFVVVSAGCGYLLRPVNRGTAKYDILPVSIPMRPLSIYILIIESSTKMWPSGDKGLLPIPGDMRLDIFCFVLLFASILTTVSFAGLMKLSTLIAILGIEVATIVIIWAACRYFLINRRQPVQGSGANSSLLGTTVVP